MRKLAVVIVMLVLAISGCTSVKVPLGGNVYNDYLIKIRSYIPEKHSVKTSVFKQNGGVRGFNFKGAYVAFKSPAFKNAGFGFDFSSTDRFATENEPAAADTFVLLDSIITPQYRARVWKITSSHPAYSNFEKEFKAMDVYIKRDSLYISVGNTSDFKDNITPEFIAQKLSEMEFEIVPKN